MRPNLLFLFALAVGGVQHVASQSPTLRLDPCRLGDGTTGRCGTLTVPEARGVKGTRELSLRVVVLPAHAPRAGASPLFLIAGGPGQAVTSSATRHATNPLRQHHDLVLMDQRGTSAQMSLDCPIPPASDPQRFFDPVFEPRFFRSCAAELAKRADLRMYSTEQAADDLDALREALGAAQVNLHGTSYGTRVALEVIRRHPARVRAAVLLSPVPIAFRNPLYHARSAQDALDALVADCAADRDCRGAYPTLRTELDSVIARLARAPARTEVAVEGSAKPAPLTLTLEAFAEGIRTLMYRGENAPRVLRAIHDAAEGDFRTLAASALTSNRNLRTSLRLGHLQAVVCSEDVPRIVEQEIARETAGTMIGDSRVRSQREACAGFPRATLSARHGDDITSATVPVLLISGTRDPVTPARWGDEAARHLTRSRHLVVPGGHAPGGECLTSIVDDFFRRADAEATDVGCAASMRFPALAPAAEAAPAATVAPRADSLLVRLVGNAGVLLSDGATSLLLDLPYQSGAFGYARYDAAALQPTGQVISVVTHHHDDHFDRSLFLARSGWRVIGPPSVTGGLPAARVLRGDSIGVGAFSVVVVPTPHTPDHRSYRVRWRGRVFYFTGDTEPATSVPPSPRLDVLFLTPWLQCALTTAGRTATWDRAVLIHLNPDRSDRICGTPERPAQGTEFRLGVALTPATAAP